MIVVEGHPAVDVHEAAAIVGRDPETVRRWVRAGRVRARRHGNKWFIDRDDIERLSRGSRPRSTMTLAEWAQAADILRAPGGQPGSTAADLVFDDRVGH